MGKALESVTRRATSKGPQVKTTEPMVSIKVTNCSIHLGWILDGFAKNYTGSRLDLKTAETILIKKIEWNHGVLVYKKA